jgi:hypothetical protein
MADIPLLQQYYLSAAIRRRTCLKSACNTLPLSGEDWAPSAAYLAKRMFTLAAGRLCRANDNNWPISDDQAGLKFDQI